MTGTTSAATLAEIRTNTPEDTPAHSPPLRTTTPVSELGAYEFPTTIDPAERYLFYLHGKIVEDQGIPAVSPEYGEYKYLDILQKLSEHEFTVISEQRPRNTDGVAYAGKIAEQVSTLLAAGVPAKNITIVGASKGAGIAIYASHILNNDELNYVIMAICHPDNVVAFLQENITLKGNLLSIYDTADDLAGSCQELFAFSQGQGISRYDEIVLDIGSGHGILYSALDEWILPIVEWADAKED